MADNLQRSDVRQVALLGLSRKDLDNLKRLQAAEPRIRNYAVLIRTLIGRAAKDLDGKES